MTQRSRPRGGRPIEAAGSPVPVKARALATLLPGPAATQVMFWLLHEGVWVTDQEGTRKLIAPKSAGEIKGR